MSLQWGWGYLSQIPELCLFPPHQLPFPTLLSSPRPFSSAPNFPRPRVGIGGWEQGSGLSAFQVIVSAGCPPYPRRFPLSLVIRISLVSTLPCPKVTYKGFGMNSLNRPPSAWKWGMVLKSQILKKIIKNKIK